MLHGPATRLPVPRGRPDLLACMHACMHALQATTETDSPTLFEQAGRRVVQTVTGERPYGVPPGGMDTPGGRVVVPRDMAAAAVDTAMRVSGVAGEGGRGPGEPCPMVPGGPCLVLSRWGGMHESTSFPLVAAISIHHLLPVPHTSYRG